MEFIYNLDEIRQAIDTVLRRELGQGGELVDSDITDSGDYLEPGIVVEKGVLDAEEPENLQEKDTLDLGPYISGDYISVESVPARVNMSAVVEDTISTPDQKLVTEDMSLKVVLTYFFYTDDSPAAVEPQADKAEASANSKDHREHSDKDSCVDSVIASESDFDADIDSLEDSCSGQSNKQQSFSMMNIFDSVCENNYDFTGSFDFGDDNVCPERACSESDRDTLDWYTDSIEDLLEHRTDEDAACAHDMGAAGKVDNSSREDYSSTTDKVDNSTKEELTQASALDTKHYKGSTFSVGKEIRHKLVRRLFSKVFQKKKYVINKKK